jgi:hypothetical protein
MHVPDQHALHVRAAIEQDADVAADLPGRLPELAREVDAHDTLTVTAAGHDALEAFAFARFEAAQVAKDFGHASVQKRINVEGAEKSDSGPSRAPSPTRSWLR